MKPRRISTFRSSIPLASALAALALTTAQQVHGQSTGNWNVNTSSSWNTSTNWTGLTGGLVPNAIGATVNFNFNITGARAITLDGNRTVGSMSVDDLTNGGSWLAYTFNAGTPSTSQLIFDVASGNAALSTATAASTATNIINVGITLNDPLVITTAKTNIAGGLSLAGVITDGASSHAITKNGNGQVTFGAANEYDGGTTINGGRIQTGTATSLGTGGVIVSSGGQAFLATAATFANNFSIAGDGYANTADSAALNGAIRFQNSIASGTVNLTGDARIGAFSGTSGTITGPLSGGARNLEINSTTNASHNGNIILTGNASSLTGTVTVSQGTLRLGTSSALGGSVVVRDNANLYGDNIGTPGAATLAGNLTLGTSGSTTTGANFYADPSSDDALLVSGNLTLNGLNTVILTGPLTSSSVILMNYAGSLTGSAANLTLSGGLAAYRPGTGFTTTGNEIKLNLVLGEITWTGSASSNWNTTESNWDDNGSPTTFYNLDSVTFNDSVATNQAIIIPTGINVAPGAMIFENTSRDYSIAGPGSIIGGGTLTKDGSGVLTVTSGNSFAGGTTLNSGSLRAGSATAFGTGPLTMTAGQLSSDNTTARTLANPLNLSGSITLGDATATGALTFSGATTLAANTTLNCGAANTVTHIMGAVITDGAGSFSLTKSGSAHLQLNTANTYDGGTTIESSRIQASNLGCFGTGTVKVLSGGQAFFSVGGTNTNNYEIEGTGWTESAGNLGAIRVAGNTLSGSITLTGDARITAHGTTGTLTGSIGQSPGPAALELSNYSTTGSTITVSGDNSYSGGTTVKGAVVIANHNNAFGTGPVNIQSNGTATVVTRVQLGTDVVINNNITINSSAETGFRGAIHSYSGSLTTPSLVIVNGTIEIQGGMGNGGHLAAESASLSVLRVMGAINVTNGTIPLVRLGSVELGGGGNYTQLNHGQDTLKLAAANGINPAAILNLGLAGTSVFDLNGFGQTLTGLTKGGSNATVTNNGAAAALTLDTASAVTYAGTFADGTSAFSLTKSGAGTLTLSGASTLFSGATTVGVGGLNLTGTLGNASATAALTAGTTLSGEGSFGGSLALTDVALNVNGSTPGSVNSAGSLDVSGGMVSVNLQSLPTVAGPIQVIACTGAFTGSAANFQLANASNYRPATFSVTAGSPNVVNLTLDAPVDLTWTGTGGSDWDVNTTSNWNDPGLVASPFLSGDNVTFADAAGGTIGLPASISATSLAINGTGNWLFQGAGTIGAGSVAKDGPGTATFEAPVSFPGTLALTAGVLKLSPPTGVTSTVTGAISGLGTLAKGGDGILSIPNANAGFTGSMVISKGELIPGNNSAFGTAAITFGDATTTTTDVCTLTLGTGLALTNTPITVADTCLSARITSTGSTIAGTTITKKGPGKLTIGHATTLGSTANVLTGTSSITIEAGTLAGSSQTPISTSTTITMGNANTGTAPTIVELPANQTTANDVVTLACPLVLSPDAPNSEAIFRYAGGTSQGSLSFSGAVSLNGRDIIFENTSNVSTPSRLYNVTGVISGNGNVRLRGGSGTTIRVQANNTFSGDLYMLSGALQTNFNTNGVESIPNTARIILSAGTRFSLSNTVETVRGLVGGAATETVTTSALFNLGRGDANPCTLTVSDANVANTHVFDGRIENGSGPLSITKSGAATQVLNGVHTYTGTTIVTGGTLEIGGAGQLGSGTYSGAMTLTSPGILKFNSTANQVLQTGVISSTGALVKENIGNLTLTAANTFSGNVTVNGGTLIGAGATNGSPGVTVLGSRTSTRIFTINNGGTLQFNSGNILGMNHLAITAPKLVINSGGVVTNGSIATNNALNDIDLNGGTLTSTTGHTGSTPPNLPVYGAWNLNGIVTSTGTSTISTSDPTKGWIMLKVVGDKTTNFNVTSGTLTVSAPVVDNLVDNNIGSLSKSGAGTMVMSAANTYSGATTVTGGTLSLGNASALGTSAATVTGGSLDLNGQAITNTVSVGALGTLTGSGSTGAATLAGIVTPSGTSIGLITLASASVASTSSVTLQLPATGTRGVDYDALTVSSALALDGTITVNITGLVPEIGQSFNLIDSTGSINVTNFNVGTDLILPALGGGLAWNTSLFASDGIVSIVNGDPFIAWAASKGLTVANNAKNADPDGDGKNNLYEFAFDGEPLSGANDGKIVGKIGTVGGNQVMTLTLPVRNTATFTANSGDQLSALIDGLYYKIEGDETLVPFADAITEVGAGAELTAIQAGLPGLSDINLDTIPDWTYRTFRAPGTVPTVPKAFLRAKISDTP